MDKITEIGLYLKVLRQERKNTLLDVTIRTNIDSTILSKIERGERLPTEEQLKALSDFFQVSFDILSTKCKAQRIINEYGINASTYEAIKIVQEKLIEYKVGNKDE